MAANHFTSESLWLNQHHQSIYFAEILIVSQLALETPTHVNMDVVNNFAVGDVEKCQSASDSVAEGPGFLSKTT